ncbi:MAG TPA: glycosyltransferase family 9 protein [Thermoanaerobaculia bacterium]|nr:glycosyltransferase family 9 protein [Thermoanaerobaculia bacterium]
MRTAPVPEQPRAEASVARAPRLLLVRLSAIGDCLHALPVAVELRRRLPDAYIGWAIEESGHRLLRGHPAVDRFHLYPRDSRMTRIAGELVELRRELRAARYDVALDLQGLTKSGLVAWLSGAPRRVSLPPPDRRELNRLFTNEVVAVPAASRHVVDRNLTLLRSVGLDAPARGRFELGAPQPSEALAPFVASLLDRGGFAVVHAGAAWPTKVWPPASLALVARGLVDRWGLCVAVTWGGEAERPLAREVVRGAQRDDVVEAPPTDLPDLAALVGGSSLFVGGDTGPMHLAVALDVPTVAVFGPTDPERNGPYGQGDLAVTAEVELSCRPCWRRSCARGDHACLAQLDAEQVLTACARRLQL